MDSRPKEMKERMMLIWLVEIFHILVLDQSTFFFPLQMICFNFWHLIVIQ